MSRNPPETCPQCDESDRLKIANAGQYSWTFMCHNCMYRCESSVGVGPITEDDDE
jgi:hypothetical protein